MVANNVVGPGCIHNCIDTKGIKGFVQNNIVLCPTSTARTGQCLTGANPDFALYSEDPFYAGSNPHWVGNLEFNVPGCIQTTNTGQTVAATIYNNTCDNVASGGYSLYLQGGGAIDVQKNIIGNGLVTTSGTSTWKYNDNFGVSGSHPIGTGDISIDPGYVSTTSTPPDYRTTNTQVNTQGTADAITSAEYLGALGPASGATPTPTPTPGLTGPSSGFLFP